MRTTGYILWLQVSGAWPVRRHAVARPWGTQRKGRYGVRGGDWQRAPRRGLSLSRARILHDAWVHVGVLGARPRVRGVLRA